MTGGLAAAREVSAAVQNIVSSSVPKDLQHARPMRIKDSKSGVTITIYETGHYKIETMSPAPLWTFEGDVVVNENDKGYTLTDMERNDWEDSLGKYREITFTYIADGDMRGGGIRLYEGKPVVLFTSRYTAGSINKNPFPKFRCTAQGLNGFSYYDTWSYSFGFPGIGPDSPWLFFDNPGTEDDAANAFIVSPASDFMIAHMTHDEEGNMEAGGIRPEITMLDRDFSHRTMLVFGKGINNTFESWGRTMTDLQGKKRPANDADAVLEKISVWTSNRARPRYYYEYDPSLGYEGTLKAFIEYLISLGIMVRVLQLDSFWYPKGNEKVGISWRNYNYGIYQLRADRDIFPDGLAKFRDKVNCLLAVHSRYWDPESPDRLAYTFSNNVPIDPRFWEDLAAYLKECGVVLFEQDWLRDLATTLINLDDPDAFLGNMAHALQKAGINIQYCTPLPCHFLQSSKYDNVTTIRVSGDEFKREYWDIFLFDSVLAAVLGLWSFTDNFVSSKVRNVLLANLSGGPIAIGDVRGSVVAPNLKQAIRADGVIVKPDASLVPMDQVYLAEARNEKTKPMVASTYTDHGGGLRTSYVFAYERYTQGTLAQARFKLSSLGMERRAFVYNYFMKQGSFVGAGDEFTDTVDYDGSYYVVVPVVAKSMAEPGIAFLGDENLFVSLGKKRIAELKEENGIITAKVIFAENEKSVVVHGYADEMPQISATEGTVRLLSYEAKTRHFRAEVTASAKHSAVIMMTASYGLKMPAVQGAISVSL